MTQVPQQANNELSAFDSSGVKYPDERAVGVSLGVGTFYFSVGDADSMIKAIHLAGDATLAATFTFETSNMLRASDGSANGVTDYDTTAGNWIQENPSTAYVGAVGTGWSAVAAVVTAAGTGVGGAMAHIGNTGARRMRVKAVVTTAGKLRVCVHGKH